MDNIEKSSKEVFFLSSIAGDILLTYFPAICPTSQRKDVIFLPPFADEMNKARRMMALQARSLAAAGIGCLFVDLYGTGDSHGDFVDARWEIWRSDIKAAINWLRQQGSQSISFLGLRMGALLAIDLAQKGKEPLEKIVLWQPILSGKNMMTQFLRLRTTANQMNTGNASETVSNLRVILADGKSLEVAGYELAPELVAYLDKIDLTSMGNTHLPPIFWFELLLNSESPLPLASQKLIEQWKANKIDISVSKIVNMPFWEGQNITVAPELLTATTEVFRETANQ